MKYLFSCCYPETTQFDKETGNLVIADHLVERWKRQMSTDYQDLSEQEKDSDRKEADKFISLIHRMNQEE